MPVSRVWRGYGSALFLELGALRPRPRLRGGESLMGERSVMIQWSWRIEAPRSIMAGSWSTDRKIDNAIQRLAGRTVLEVEVQGRIPELVITLSGGLWLYSFAAVEPQPQWVLFLGDGDWLHVERGRILRNTWIEPAPG